MTLGMLSGAVWAKAALGTLLGMGSQGDLGGGYLVLLSGIYHFRLGCPAAYRKALFGLLVSFLLLQMCWYGINYLPSAQGSECTYV